MTSIPTNVSLLGKDMDDVSHGGKKMEKRNLFGTITTEFNPYTIGALRRIYGEQIKISNEKIEPCMIKWSCLIRPGIFCQHHADVGRSGYHKSNAMVLKTTDGMNVVVICLDPMCGKPISLGKQFAKTLLMDRILAIHKIHSNNHT